MRRNKKTTLTEYDIQRINFLRKEIEFHFQNMVEAYKLNPKRYGYNNFKQSIKANFRAIKLIREGKI
jgi:uncharacterized protein (DUF1800 family)